MNTDPRERSRLYDEPAVYDLLSPWPIDDEVNGWLDVAEQHIVRAVTSLLDPSCGSGRILEAFAQQGVASVGIDLSPAMVAYCGTRFQDMPLATATAGDMRAFDLHCTFDLAVQAVNSFRLLTADDDVRSHLACMRRHLPRGVYIIELWLQGANGNIPFRGQEWNEQRDDVSATVWYGVERVDNTARRVYERACIDFQNSGRVGHIDELTEMRLWHAEELEQFVADQGAFRLKEWRDTAFAPLSTVQLVAGTPHTFAVLVPA